MGGRESGSGRGTALAGAAPYYWSTRNEARANGAEKNKTMETPDEPESMRHRQIVDRAIKSSGMGSRRSERLGGKASVVAEETGRNEGP